MSLTQEQIAHIARLSRLNPTPEELARYQRDLSSIVEYVDMLAKVPKESLDTVALTSPLILPLREDKVVQEGKPSRKELLSCTEQRVVADQIAIPNIMA